MAQEHSDTNDSRRQQPMALKLNFNAGVIIAIILQTAGIVWWASQLQSQVSQSYAEIQQIKTNCCSITRVQLDDILASRDAKIDSLNQQFADFRIENRTTLQRIEKKL